MSNWTEGYVADVGYTYGYYAELNPLRAQWAFANAGLMPPTLPAAGGAACELGFGQGVSIATHAAASPLVWWGTDFNPSQAAHAMQLVNAAGLSARLFDEAFADFCNRPDLPEFDSIGLHGIWSWISDENRQIIVDFVRRKLKVGGVLYVSYNTQPGWSSMVPLRHLLTQHAATMGAPGQGIVNRIEASLDFATKLMGTNPAYARLNPGIADRLKKIVGQDRNYLAHEYFNQDWHPMHFATMAKWLERAKLGFGCSAQMLDHVDAINLTAEQRALVQEPQDATFRETVRDMCVNQQFRKDYWIKGPRKLTPLEQVEILRKQRLILTTSKASVPMKATGALGDATLQTEIYEPILDALADGAVHSFAQIEQVVASKVTSFAQLKEALTVLIGIGVVQLAQDEKLASKLKPQTDKLNAHILNQARAGGLNFLASPVTAGGFSINRVSQLFLLAKASGRKTAEEWAEFAWSILNVQGQRIIKDGKTLESAEDNLREVHDRAKEFLRVQLPTIKALMIA